MSSTDTTPAAPKHDFKAIGHAAQMLPAYLRVVCRSRFDCTPYEVLEIARQETTDKIQALKDEGFNYVFLDEHHEIVIKTPIDEILIVIEGNLTGGIKNPLLQHMMNQCPMQAHNGSNKTARSKCWTCPIISDVLKELKKMYR